MAFFRFTISDRIELFKLYYGVDVSLAFATCADVQLPRVFETITGIDLKDGAWMNWDPKGKFEYEKGQESRIGTSICLAYGQNPAKIVWKSKSGRIYDINDKDIDCHDIEFWFEGIDAEYCRKVMYPKWSLITFPESYVEGFNKKSESKLSIEFIRCADKQLTLFFEKAVGMKVNRHTTSFIQEDEFFSYRKGIISRLAAKTIINHNWNNNVTILWKSKSGRVYDMADTDIDCNDIEFWFEGLEPLLYHKQMFPKAELPFKLKNLSYKLVINRLNMDCIIEMKLKEDELANAEIIMKKVDDCITGFNLKSEKNDRDEGVVHNWKRKLEVDQLIYEIDTGFAGPNLMKALLPFLSKLKCFTVIEIN